MAFENEMLFNVNFSGKYVRYCILELDAHIVETVTYDSNF